MRVFVTGAGGFLGSTLVGLLRSNGYEVDTKSSAECDLRINGSLKMQVSDIRYDLIVHLAAWTQAGDFCLKYPGQQWINNQLINTNVLDWWLEMQPQAKLVFMGTSCVYPPELPLIETNFMKGEPIDSLYTYAMTKRMLLQGARALSKEYGMKYLCLVPSTLYGPGYHTDGRQMHFIFDLIRKIIRGKEYGEEVVLWGNGHQKRELVHVNDFCNIALQLIRTQDSEVINIGAGREYAIRDFAKAICSTVGYDDSRVQYDVSRYTGAESKCLDITRLEQCIGAFQQIDLDLGLRETVNWFYKTGCY